MKTITVVVRDVVLGNGELYRLREEIIRRLRQEFSDVIVIVSGGFTSGSSFVTRVSGFGEEPGISVLIKASSMVEEIWKTGAWRDVLKPEEPSNLPPNGGKR
jgi:hypothetical protein